ncbi:MAG: cytochrome c [Gammaproteobacteria bacterium]
MKPALVIALAAALAACAHQPNPLDQYEEVRPDVNVVPPDNAAAAQDPARVARGRYLVELLGCAVCHTDGALVGKPDPARTLAGSRIGIAYTNPLVNANPGVLYPPNLTPDTRTGLGRWSDEQVFRFIRTGLDPGGRRHLSVMPWPAFARMSEDDTRAIVAYLRTLAPIEHAVPAGVAEGTKAPAPFVHFGVYRSRGLGP